MLQAMSIDRLLAIFGLLTAVVGIVASRVFYVRTIRSKLLAVGYTPPVSLLLSIPDAPRAMLKAAAEPSRFFLLLWNKGAAPIEANDFIEPIKILPPEKIIQVAVHEKDAMAVAAIDEVEKKISVNLLRPGEAIIFAIDTMDEAHVPNISVQMKSPDMSVFLRTKRSDPRERLENLMFLIPAMVCFPLFWALGGRKGIGEFTIFGYESGWIVMVIAFVLSFGIGIVLAKTFQRRIKSLSVCPKSS